MALTLVACGSAAIKNSTRRPITSNAQRLTTPAPPDVPDSGSGWTLDAIDVGKA